MLDGIRQFVKRHMMPGPTPDPGAADAPPAGAAAPGDSGPAPGDSGPAPGDSGPAPGDSGAAAAGADPVALAACALLLEVAHADGEFSEAERLHIENAVGRHFGLDGATTAELLRLADEERRTSIDHFQFTRVIAEEYDLGAKMVLAEILWGVILADGKIAAHEEYLVRKLANLLQLEPGYLSEARRSARRPHFDP
jgi:uncharacterized tellurite resistance protein B-like protein